MPETRPQTTPPSSCACMNSSSLPCPLNARDGERRSPPTDWQRGSRPRIARQAPARRRGREPEKDMRPRTRQRPRNGRMGLGPLQERGAAAAVDLILMGGLEESGQLDGAVATVVRSVSDQEEGPPVQCILHAWSTCKKLHREFGPSFLSLSRYRWPLIYCYCYIYSHGMTLFSCKKVSKNKHHSIFLYLTNIFNYRLN